MTSAFPGSTVPVSSVSRGRPALDDVDAIPALLGALTVRLPTGDAPGSGPRKVDVGLLAVAGKTFGPVTLTGSSWTSAWVPPAPDVLVTFGVTIALF